MLKCRISIISNRSVLKSRLVGFESDSHQRKHSKKFFLVRKIQIMFCNTCILMFYVVTFFEWVVLCNCWMQTSSVALVMYYTIAQEKHPSVLKGQHTQRRHYDIFEVMQYEPQSATFQL